MKILELLKLTNNDSIIINNDRSWRPRNGWMIYDYKILLNTYSQNYYTNFKTYIYFQRYVLINYLIILEKFRIKLKNKNEIKLIIETLKSYI